MTSSPRIENADHAKSRLNVIANESPNAMNKASRKFREPPMFEVNFFTTRRLIASIGLGVVWLATCVSGVHAQTPSSTKSADASQSKSAEQPESQSPGQTPKRRLGGLPWADERDEIRPTRVRLPSPRKMLEVGFDIGASQLTALTDGQPLQSDDEETVLRILFAIRRFQPDDMEQWRRDLPPWSELSDGPDALRTEVFDLHGRVRGFEQRELLPEVERLFQRKHYYVVNVVNAKDDVPMEVCCLEIPESWKKASSLNERIQAYGMFLKLGGEVGGRASYVFATSRISWRPDSATQIPNVSTSEQYLAELGVDISLFEVARERNGRSRMGAEDREAFYQVKDAASRADSSQVKQISRPFSLTGAIQKPQPLQGGFFTVRGKARRITRVVISERESDIRERFGIDHYFQIDFFIPLGDLTLQLSGKGDQTASPIYQNGFPAIACVRSLPPELFEANERLAEGKSGEELLNEEIELTGVFFRLWAYKSEYVDAFDAKQKQVSPMFLGSMPTMVKQPPTRNPYLGIGVGAVFIVALGAIWISVYRAGKSDTRFERDTLRKRRQSADGKSLDDLGIEAESGPDFSNLD